MLDEQNQQTESKEYLLFTVGNIIYATPLLDVREIVKPQTYKPVPNTADCFLGVLNLRGQIVGVIDFRIKLKQTSETEGEALLVFETEIGVLAALVDDVVSVREISEESIERKPHIVSPVPLEFLIGVGKVDGDVVNVIDLNKVLGNEHILISKTFEAI